MSKLITAVVVDTVKLTLYHTDGSSLNIPQGDPRVAHILEKIIPAIDAGQVVEADYSETTYYHEFEKQTNGFVRFFRAAKKSLANVFKEPSQIGSENIAPVGEHGRMTKQDRKALKEIMDNATPVSAEGYRDADTTDDHTIVAVVNNKVIPGAEALKNQIKSSVKLGSTAGMERFFERISSVINERRHSIEDVLRFLERGDLPIADDGSIIGYKLLYRRGEGYVDCHTQRVNQRVGSHVFMDAKLVDPNRRNECSTGLHVARRGYLRNFSGDVCVLVKIAPEDVIAVPNYDANKVRVCGYHILAELSQEAFVALKRDHSMTGSKEGQRVLANALRGNHPAPDQLVQITQPNGNGVNITNLASQKFDRSLLKQEFVKSLDQQENITADPYALASAQMAKAKTEPKKVEAPKAQPTSSSKQPSRKDKAQSYVLVLADSKDAAHRHAAATNLVALKKASKVGWSVLGVTDTVAATAVKLAAEPAPQVTEAIKTITKTVADRAKGSTKKASKQSKKKAPKASTAKPTTAKVPTEAIAGETRQEKARRLFKANDMKGLLAHKRQSKQSWGKLGFTLGEITLLKKMG